MTIQRMDHVGIVVDDLPAATEFCRAAEGRASLHLRARRVNGCGLNPSLGARKVVREAILAPDNNEIYAAYTLIRENLQTNDPGRTR